MSRTMRLWSKRTCRVDRKKCASFGCDKGMLGIMKKRVHITGFLLFFIISTSVHAGIFDSSQPVPDWFTTPPTGTKGYEYYGTGMGADDKEAQGNARAAIAASIRSDIDSGFISKEEVKKGSYSQEKRHVLSVKTY